MVDLNKPNPRGSVGVMILLAAVLAGIIYGIAWVKTRTSVAPAAQTTLDQAFARGACAEYGCSSKPNVACQTCVVAVSGTSVADYVITAITEEDCK